MKTLEQLIDEEKLLIQQEQQQCINACLDNLKQLYGDELFNALNINNELAFFYKNKKFYLYTNAFDFWYIDTNCVNSRRLLLEFLGNVS